MLTAKEIHALGRVVVLVGGDSAERDISLLGGNAVLQALLRQGIDAELRDVSEGSLPTSLQSFDRAFIMVHGHGGEDGRLQGYLETLNIPYTGSGVTASVLAMDKYLSKLLWENQGIPLPEYVVLKALPEGDIEGLPDYPLVVKPCAEGSSIGLSLAFNKEELNAACIKAFSCSHEILIEQWIDGDELTLSMVGDEFFPLIAIETPNALYDYQAKYQSDDTRYLFPELTDAEVADIEKLSRQAFNALGVTGWGRIDLMRDKQKNPYFLEINTVPGMTDHSLVPKAAQQAGLNYDDLVIRILQESLQA